MEWEKVLANAVQDGRIRELHLRKIPRLKTCANWREVEPIGWIDYKMRFAHYKGGIVKLNSKIYFVTEQTLNALSEFISIKFKTTLAVIKD
ncbi:MAG TPA: hypothetical protein PKM65_18890 [Spirochaetota bacterium]|nr:hypothetical protein [Spirochaetota bacterium]HNT11423.1 hypothetical protein [Spirochaetota bacterium]HNV45728.1 hypothetical protein [Spirochaetota bacterium]HOS38516.1 hypothetical protein [Spirochaetota bacterium]HPI22571.1 hypothetical protein [Spirochaetota bacterium]